MRHSSPERPWAVVDRQLGWLPPDQLADLVVVRHTLATWYAPDGQFANVLTRPTDAPLLEFGAWLRADLPAITPAAAAAQFAWSALQWMALMVEAHVADPDTALDGRYLPLAGHLRRRSGRFWRLLGRAGVALPAAQADPPALRQLMELAALLAARAAQRPDLGPMLQGMAGAWATAIELFRDIQLLRRDLAHGRRSALIAALAQAAGAGGIDPVPAATILGALVLTPVLAERAAAAQAALAAAQRELEQAGLPVLGAAVADATATVERVGRSLRLGAPPPEPGGLRMLAPGPGIEDALRHAEGYLLADRSFRASWEVQRTDLLGQAALTASAFPAGTILELLACHGHAAEADIAMVVATLRENGVQYYNEPPAPLTDADDLGLLLRLLARSPQRAAAAPWLDPLLRRTLAMVPQDGRCPIWFVDDATRGQAMLWGDQCVTVQAQLARGLLAYDPQGHAPVIDRVAGAVCAAILAHGLAANAYYVPRYALWVLRLLLSEWAPRDPSRRELRRQAGGELDRWAGRLARQAPATAQDSALVLLHAAAAGAPIAGAEIRALLARQRYDGSWPAAPLYISPTRAGGADWYESNLVTTALCYHALRQATQAPA